MEFRKKLLASLQVMVPLLLVMAAYVSVAGAKPLRGVDAARTPNGNKHDFSSGNTTNAFHSEEIDQVCIFCHTPHGATAQSTLWNRPAPDPTKADLINTSLSLAIGQNPAAQAASGYYGGSSLPGGDSANYPNGSTRLCMSCHDGVTAIGAFLNGERPSLSDPTMAEAPNIMPLGSVVDLATSHPVSFTYGPGVVAAIEAVKGAETYRLPILPATTLDGMNRMQCTTCHDPHEDTLADPQVALPFWRHVGANAAASYNEVCASCHIAPPGGSGGSH